MDINTAVNKNEYQNHVKKTMPKSKLVKECIMAFIVGGLICVFGEALNDLGKTVLKLDEAGVSTFRSAILIFLCQ
jgi:stage V sporulation protein AC